MIKSLIIFLLISLKISAQDQANILWIYVDDMSPWMSCYGDQNISTPHIDSLTENGVLFKQAYMPSAVCSTTRSALITGTMQKTFGLHQHRTRLKQDLPKHVLTVPEILKAAGYLSFNEAKDDYNFSKKRDLMYSQSFKRPSYKSHLKGFDLSWLQQLQGKKFFGQIQLAGGKFGGETGGKYPDKSRIDEKTLTIPPQYPDHPVFRNAFARHYEQVIHTDLQVGAIIDALKKYDLYENTIIFFFTDHGSPLPRSKQFLYEEGTKVPLIIHSPKFFDTISRHGTLRHDLVSGIDISATTLALAKVEIPKYMEGQDLLSENFKERSHIVTARDRCGNAIDYIRAIRTKNFRYIRNFKNDRPLLQLNYRNNYAVFKTLNQLKQQGKLSPLQSSYFEPNQRPAEELYEINKDPHEVKNLAANPEYQTILNQHRQLLKKWQEESDDQGQYPESDERLKDVLRSHRKKCSNPEYKNLK